MERGITIGCVVVLIALAGWIGYNAFDSPMQQRSLALKADVSKIKPMELSFPKPNWDTEKWQQSVAAKPNLWTQLVEPPKAEPPPPPTPPNPNEMIKDVRFSKQGIGVKKIKLFKGADTKGEWASVGDTINGLVLKEITKGDVTLTLKWNDQELTATKQRE